jgi:N-acyl-D-aspartate/D-glutamate deacylase
LVISSCKLETYDLIIQQTSAVDVHTGKILTGTDIGITNGQIIAIKQSLQPTEGHSEIINGTGKYVIPGLCDGHTHLGFLTTLGGDSLNTEMSGFVRHGVLYVRDVGGPIDVMQQMQERISSGELMGPEIFYTGPMLESSPLYWERFNKTLAGFTVALDQKKDVDTLLPVLAENGATMIKTFNNINPDLYPYIVRIARQNQLKIVHDPGRFLSQTGCRFGKAAYTFP